MSPYLPSQQRMMSRQPSPVLAFVLGIDGRQIQFIHYVGYESPNGLAAASLVAKEAAKTLDQGCKLEIACS